MSFKLIPFLFLLTNHVSQAAIVAGSVQVGGASARFLSSDTQWRVFGSFVGPDKGYSGTDTFNNCDVAPTGGTFVGCNRNRVAGSTLLSVTFIDDVQYTGLRPVRFYLKTGVTLGESSPNLIETPPNVPQGNTYVAQVSWAALCNAAGGTLNNYIAAQTAFGGTTSMIACMDNAAPSEPLNKVVQFAAGIDNGSGLASSEILLDIRFATPAPNIGIFSPQTIGPPVEGSDGYVGRAGCLKEVTPLSAGPAVTTGTTVTGSSGQTFTGFCDFNLKPGDEKVRLDSNPGAVNTLDIYSPTVNVGSSTIPIRGFRLFLSNNGFENTNPWSSNVSYEDNLFNTVGVIESGFENSTLSSSKIKNDVPVFARMSTLDEAGNVTHLFSDALIQANCGVFPGSVPALGAPNFFEYFIGAVAQPDDPGVPNTGRCPYATVPSLVTGILEDDINCFIATALKGSPYDYQVMALREFRNRFLKSFSLGRSFIDFYYEHGPKAADWLNRNPEYKPIFRVLLWPAYLVAFVFNSLGGLLGLGLMLLILLTPLSYFSLRKKS